MVVHLYFGHKMIKTNLNISSGNIIWLSSIKYYTFYFYLSYNVIKCVNLKPMVYITFCAKIACDSRIFDFCSFITLILFDVKFYIKFSNSLQFKHLAIICCLIWKKTIVILDGISYNLFVVCNENVWLIT